jgi:two-component system copper resistance phosphate regulon response regulator CusR
VRLLLIEDEPLTIRMLAKGLREQAYAVDVAQSAHAALALVADYDYDLVVLDLGLPDLDGLKLCRRIRDAGTTAPILILTARDAVDSRIAGLDSGADDYLLKPFDFGELLARLRALIRRGARPPQNERLHVGPLVLDMHAQAAFCRDTPLPLTTREYALLEFMARHAGRVVTREDIAEHVWDSSYDPLSNVIDVYVRRLRAKLAPTSCHEAIRTRRGAGYMLSADWSEQEP